MQQFEFLINNEKSSILIGYTKKTIIYIKINEKWLIIINYTCVVIPASGV